MTATRTLDLSSGRVYLDANATTPVLPEVADAVVLGMSLHGNPSSLHAAGRDASRRLTESRAATARFLGADGRNVAFTSGGTEACRLGVLGALAAAKPKRHVVCSAIEHPAIRDLLRAMTADGVEVSWVRPDAVGRVSVDDVRAALRDDTALAAVMWANNETGVLQPVREIAAACRERGVALVSDAVQCAGKVPVDFRASGIDVLAVAAHKFHGPRGVGALLVRDGARWKAPFPASHEMGRRAGTESLPLIAGFAAACDAAAKLTSDDRAAIAALRDRLESALTGALDGVTVNGTGDRVPNTSNVSFAGIESERLLAMLDRAGVDASNGSACSSRSPEPSHVLTSMGLGRAQAMSAVRFSLSRMTTRAEIDRAIAATIEAVETLRASIRR
ncbi:MAG: cysteine desulfurase [Planctomycetes bacterium]|nr:cysteine desulfurase [Planctomycetota bacterium]